MALSIQKKALIETQRLTIKPYCVSNKGRYPPAPILIKQKA